MSATPTYDKLRVRLKRFVDHFVRTGNGAEAMRRIGFKGPQPKVAACKLRKKPHIAKAIEEKNAIAVRDAERSAAEVLEVIGETMDRCRQAVPVFDEKGNPVLVKTPTGDLAPAYVFDAKNVLKAAELLGKYHRLFAERHEHSGPNGERIGPVYLIAREEAKQIAEDLDSKV